MSSPSEIDSEQYSSMSSPSEIDSEQYSDDEDEEIEDVESQSGDSEQHLDDEDEEVEDVESQSGDSEQHLDDDDEEIVDGESQSGDYEQYSDDENEAAIEDAGTAGRHGPIVTSLRPPNFPRPQIHRSIQVNEEDDQPSPFKSQKPNESNRNKTAHENLPITIPDQDIFDCPICYENLKSPVYQCENGHIVCDSCCRKILNKCPSCKLPTGSIRCRAIEKIIEASHGLLKGN